MRVSGQSPGRRLSGEGPATRSRVIPWKIGTAAKAVTCKKSAIALLAAMQNSTPHGGSYSVMNSEAEEYHLALRAREGDRDALASLVERTRRRLFSLAY